MSQENVEIVRRAYEHFRERRDFLAEAFHPDFVWDMSTFRGWPERRTYPGIEGASEFLTEWLAAWDEWELELEEMHDAGGERVVAIVRQQGRSKATGLPVDMRFAQVWTLSNGKQVRMEMYATPDEALEATGLRQTRSAAPDR